MFGLQDDEEDAKPILENVCNELRIILSTYEQRRNETVY